MPLLRFGKDFVKTNTAHPLTKGTPSRILNIVCYKRIKSMIDKGCERKEYILEI